MSESPSRPNVWARRKARRALVQAVYQWQLSGNDIAQIRAEFHNGDALRKADRAFFDDVFSLTARHVGDLDESFAGLLDRQVSQLDQVERALLRLAAAELHYRIDVPYRVVIDEYVELAKTFGAEESHKYVNGVLDKLAGQCRTIEVEAARRGGSG